MHLYRWEVSIPYGSIKSQTRRDPKEMERLETKIEEWEHRYQKVRHDQTFFITASSLVNILLIEP